MRHRERNVRIIFVSVILLALLVGLGLTFLSGQYGSYPPGESSGLMEWIRALLDSSGR